MGSSPELTVRSCGLSVVSLDALVFPSLAVLRIKNRGTETSLGAKSLIREAACGKSTAFVHYLTSLTKFICLTLQMYRTSFLPLHSGDRPRAG